jgi:hypothetical protein
VTGASYAAATKAAETMAAFRNRFAKTDCDLNLLKWMVGFNLAVTTSLLALALKH